MSGDQTAQVIWYVLALTLVGSALLSRRVSLKGALGMALIWVGIFLLVLIAFSYRQELGLVATRVQTKVTGAPRQQMEGNAIRIALAADGHYWVEGNVNGVPARFLVDSGASITALSEATTRLAGLIVDQQRIAMMQTANGPVEAKYSVVPTLAVGAIKTSDLTVVVSPAFGEVNVLGMNFLSQLKSWRVEDGEMILEPK
ncbi:TIGR02281 family clan AA aspartic protease [Sphingobium phenoxybenzoativorans]|uniref:TIGR02281 family clan AA aspartic protease n=1 Tax=Sphingobium phenoxybenzoativorans TaxID=1592790 RepID=A0A975PZM5_9SPHN|nr:TIGR02281 family clan AA aspartic protease [Sphingobium phenoxybenzoativorans]QUT03896.1 TIGR02281 family clan AA aspartic protease [Sphingobium phenoxybenzoativorans]